jgi:hypothetical protein
MVIYQVLFPNGKMYIGKTKNLKNRKYIHLWDAKKGSDLIFHRAIMKYGEENLTWNVIYECDEIEKLNEMEIFFIKKFDSINPEFGYNMICGDKIDYGLRKNFDIEYQIDIIKKKLKSNGHNPDKYVIINEELSTHIIDDYLVNKLSIKALVRKYSISKNRITRFLLSQNIDIDAERCVLTNSIKLSDEQINNVIEKFQTKKTIKDIASEEGLTIMIVSRILHDYGVRESKRFKNGKRYDGKQPKNRKSDNQD